MQLAALLHRVLHLLLLHPADDALQAGHGLRMLPSHLEDPQLEICLQFLQLLFTLSLQLK